MGRHKACLLILLLLSAGSAAGSIALGRRHKDESSGFQIQPPRKWEQVPTKFREVALAAKWAGKIKRGIPTPELHVVRLVRQRLPSRPQTNARSYGARV